MSDSAQQPEAKPEDGIGRYNIRMGASTYAPIIGLFGSLTVPAIVLAFDIAPKGPDQKEKIALTTGLLVIGLLGSLLSALGLSALGAEERPTANLSPAIMLHAVSAAIAIASVFGALEVLAAYYHSSAKTLFSVATASAGL